MLNSKQRAGNSEKLQIQHKEHMANTSQKRQK